MKVKKVGEIPKPPAPVVEKEETKKNAKEEKTRLLETEDESSIDDNIQSLSAEPKSSLHKMYYIIGGSIVFLLGIIIIY